ncbi:MAG: DUF302 domain-containing protein [Salaquimonas sp.]
MKNTVLAGIATAIMITSAQAADSWIVKDGSLSVGDTVAKLEMIIEAAPPTLMAKIDHGAGAKKAGMDIGESVLLVLGAPAIGTPMMLSNRLIGLDLPAKILVYDENGKTKIAYTDPRSLKSRYNIEGADAQFDGMAKALGNFTDAASK